jgi:hypothetical protein
MQARLGLSLLTKSAVKIVFDLAQLFAHFLTHAGGFMCGLLTFLLFVCELLANKLELDVEVHSVFASHTAAIACSGY